MEPEELKGRIQSLATHILFDYKGVAGGVDPFNAGDFDLWYGDVYLKAHSIEEVMTAPVFDGKSLNDIATELKNIEY